MRSLYEERVCMSRHEFIETLQASLNRSLTPSLVADHIKYYEEYIRMRVASGENESAVLAALGDPRLIARTIVENCNRAEGASGSSGASYRETFYSGGTYQEETGNASYREAVSRRNGTKEIQTVHQIRPWLFWILVIGVIVLVLGVIVSLVSFLLPLVIPVMVIVFLIKLFRDWLN